MITYPRRTKESCIPNHTGSRTPKEIKDPKEKKCLRGGSLVYNLIQSLYCYLGR